MKYAWIKAHENEFPIYAMCASFNVVRSAYYQWRNTPKTVHDQRDADLTILVEEEFKKGRSVYGEMRVWKRLQQKGIKTSRRRVGRLMAEAGLVCITRKPYKATTDSKHDKPIAKNKLNRRFNPEKPNQVYAGDITYIKTDEGWLYLAMVMDLFSRQIVGWSMADHIRRWSTMPCGGNLATKTAKGRALAYRSWQSICVERTSGITCTTWNTPKYESQGKLLG